MWLYNFIYFSSIQFLNLFLIIPFNCDFLQLGLLRDRGTPEEPKESSPFKVPIGDTFYPSPSLFLSLSLLFYSLFLVFFSLFPVFFSLFPSTFSLPFSYPFLSLSVSFYLSIPLILRISIKAFRNIYSAPTKPKKRVILRKCNVQAGIKTYRQKTNGQ